ncbi:MAG: topoisomerase DNA-binding C4 zinc finger domain-containing protein, partial [Bordetella sp.]|nr:topoisomerase DNA-binding C4 zinc finger domain-containing protein [Bordetella sp.]
GAVSIERPDGRPIQEECCTWCKRGVLVLRKGGYGPFLGCTNYPDCRYTRKVRGETTVQSDGPIVENRSREVPQAPVDPLAALGALGRRIATARARHADATAPLASVPDVAPRRVADD